MRRDMDLVREILFAFEKKSRLAVGAGKTAALPVEGYEHNEIDYHIDILVDSGLIAASPTAQGGIDHFRLSWDGHEFLESVRSDTHWNKVKARMADIGAFVFSIARAVAIQELQERLS